HKPAPAAEPSSARVVRHSVNHAHHEDRIRPPGANRKRHGDDERPLTQTHTNRVARYGVFTAVPHTAGIVEDLYRPVFIIDGIVSQPVSSSGIEIVFVPPPEVSAVPHDEPLRKRRPPVDHARIGAIRQYMPSVAEPVLQMSQVRRESEIAGENSGG